MKRSFSTVIWDFDGVIIESMHVRDDAFRHALRDYPQDEVEALVGYHQANGGLSRFHKFGYFYEEIRKETPTDQRIAELAASFSSYCMERLCSPLCLIPETITFIRGRQNGLAHHIASGSAEVELRQICEAHGIASLFSEIRGSPTPKIAIVAELIASRALNREQTILIGDARNDYEAAAENGIRFYGYRNPVLKGLGTYLDTLEQLP